MSYLNLLIINLQKFFKNFVARIKKCFIFATLFEREAETLAQVVKLVDTLL